MKRKKAILALADGTIFEGFSVGADGECTGEVVFNTSMTGYQEILTDPSYKGQIVTMTYPLIGNYGVNDTDVESLKPCLEGFIIKEHCPFPSNWRSQSRLDEFLKKNGIVCIEGIDTRALTRHIRDVGEQQGVISTTSTDVNALIEKAKISPGLTGRDLAQKVTTGEKYRWEDDGQVFVKSVNSNGTLSFPSNETGTKRFNVVVYDCGVKFNILRNLVKWGCNVVVVPTSTKADEVLSLEPDGVFFSNGPGDPSAVLPMIDNAKNLIGKKPVMGICLGHQILSLALGCKTYKLKFGHHGGNHPVMDLKTKKVEITAQNHGFAVDVDSVSNRSTSNFGPINVTHVNLNDQSLEGLECKEIPLFSVQYHPEASPGPHDSNHIFKKFIQMMSN
ncbi:MAG: glutamine-hydrolyzing carbamoyl-phosphate synthase small subunit [Candidatus Anammoxibacter sp.]